MTRDERIAKWYKNQRSALFIHWGVNTENPDCLKNDIPKIKSGKEFERIVNEGGWNAGKWVESAKKLHAGYITLAIFHGALGYIRPYKSKIPGTYVTERDFLGELIEEAKKEGIKVLLYITSDILYHKYTLYDNNMDLDPKGYADYKNDQSINIINRTEFQRIYVKDILDELIDNYPDLAGFWFDGWNRIDICDEIFGFVHEKDPEKIVIKNDFKFAPTDNEDVMSLEDFSKQYYPEYDYSSGTWADIETAECCYVGLGDWWHYEQPEKPDNLYLIRRMVSIMAKGWVASVGMGPKLGGDFPDEMNEFFDFAKNYLAWAEESLFGTKKGGFASGYFNDGAYGFTTQKEGKCYIHLCEAPNDNALIIPNLRYNIKQVKNLKTGEIYSYENINGSLKILVDDFSDIQKDGIMVFEVNVEELAEIETISGIIDEISYTAELKNISSVKGISIFQNENCCVKYGGWGAVESKNIKEFEIAISNDGQEFRSILSGILPNKKGQHDINLEKVDAKFVKVTVISTYYNEDNAKVWSGKWQIADLPNNVVDSIDNIPEKLLVSNVNISSCTVSPSGDTWYVSNGKLYGDDGQEMFMPFKVKQVLYVKDNSLFVVDEDGNVYLDDYEGTNSTPIGHDAQRLERKSDTEVIKYDKPFTEKCNIKTIKLF